MESNAPIFFGSHWDTMETARIRNEERDALGNYTKFTYKGITFDVQYHPSLAYYIAKAITPPAPFVQQAQISGVYGIPVRIRHEIVWPVRGIASTTLIRSIYPEPLGPDSPYYAKHYTNNLVSEKNYAVQLPKYKHIIFVRDPIDRFCELCAFYVTKGMGNLYFNAPPMAVPWLNINYPSQVIYHVLAVAALNAKNTAISYNPELWPISKIVEAIHAPVKFLPMDKVELYIEDAAPGRMKKTIPSYDYKIFKEALTDEMLDKLRQIYAEDFKLIAQ